MKIWGKPTVCFGSAHDELNFEFGFESAARISGTRFAMLRGQLARLHRVLGQFMLDRQIERGYCEVNPPLLVRADTMFGTGQLPKFKEDLFYTSVDEERNALYLIPTAEVSLTNYVREQILPADEFPKRLVALTPCFRAEAGAAGRDTRGMIRQHQFEKVELVSLATAEQWQDEHQYMIESAEAILEALDLPYRRVLLCTGDMGFSARKTYDLEVWLPGQGCYREISSVSYCGEFQARRMNARYKDADGNHFLHTLNGSGLAVGRTLVAVLENYQLDNNRIEIPQALRPYFGGLAVLENGC
jgi:seryl-tRNA synthetase